MACWRRGPEGERSPWRSGEPPGRRRYQWQPPIIGGTTLLFYGYDEGPVRDFLWGYALTRRPIQILSVYLAHLILRQVDWSLRHHEEAVSDRYITRGHALLAEIETRL